MKRRLLIWGSVWLALVLIDSATKYFIETEDWAWHPVETLWWRWFGPLLFLIPFLWGPMRLGGILGSAGAFGNTVWAYHPKGVPNPFQDDNGILAYNFADVCVLLSKPVLIIGVFIWMVRQWIKAYHDRFARDS